MATVFSHALIGYSLARCSSIPPNRRYLFFMSFLPVIPDFDYIGWIFRVPYGSLWGHRGFTHSILFAALLALLASTFLHLSKNNRPKVIFFLFMAALSHGVTDAMTNGGLGIAFFSPFDLSRYFFSWRPIEVSPMGPRFFSQRGVTVLLSEVLYIWLPMLTAISLKKRIFFRQTP